MALTHEDAVREWTGSTPTSQAIADALERFDDDPLLAARSILRRHLADMAMLPGDLTVEQDASRKWLEWQVELVERRIAAVSAATEDEEESAGLGTVTVGRLSRTTPGR